MKRREICQLAGKMMHAADVLDIDALPETWPDWMTPDKRRQMAGSFRAQARAIAVEHGLREAAGWRFD